MYNALCAFYVDRDAIKATIINCSEHCSVPFNVNKRSFLFFTRFVFTEKKDKRDYKQSYLRQNRKNYVINSINTRFNFCDIC